MGTLKEIGSLTVECAECAERRLVVSLVVHEGRLPDFLMANKGRKCYIALVDDQDKQTVVIAATILVARHLKTIEEFRDSKPSPRTQSLIANAVGWAQQILQYVNKEN